MIYLDRIRLTRCGTSLRRSRRPPKLLSWDLFEGAPFRDLRGWMALLPFDRRGRRTGQSSMDYSLSHKAIVIGRDLCRSFRRGANLIGPGSRPGCHYIGRRGLGCKRRCEAERC